MIKDYIKLLNFKLQLIKKSGFEFCFWIFFNLIILALPIQIKYTIINLNQLHKTIFEYKILDQFFSE